MTTDPNALGFTTTHPAESCQTQSACPLHNPSDHHMRGWTVIWRDDIGVLERLCAHGIGHPDPDQVPHWIDTGRQHLGVHGCDGCCAPNSDTHTTERTTPMNEPQYPYPPPQYPSQEYPPQQYPYVPWPPAAAYQPAPSAASAAASTVVIGGHRRGPNHALHALLTLVTCGMWAPVWIFVAITDQSRARY